MTATIEPRVRTLAFSLLAVGLIGCGTETDEGSPIGTGPGALSFGSFAPLPSREVGDDGATTGFDASTGTGDVASDGGGESTGGFALASSSGAAQDSTASSDSGTSSVAGTTGIEVDTETDAVPVDCLDQEAADGDLSALSDEFDDPRTMECWRKRYLEEGTPRQYEVADIDTTKPGHFYLRPTTSGWFEAFRGPYFYKEITGDFMMEIQVRAGSRADENVPPSLPYNSAGLMIRDPAYGPGLDDWVSWNFGAQAGAEIMTEGKNTTNSSSHLLLRPAPPFGTLRVCRVGATVLLSVQYEGLSRFRAAHLYDRPDLPETLQAGISISAWNTDAEVPDESLEPDLQASWDYVRFTAIDDPQACLED